MPRTYLIILFFIIAVLAVASRIIFYRTSNVKGLRYEIHRYIDQWLHLLCFLAASWTFLSFTKFGFRSGPLWWFLCFTAGTILTWIIRLIANKVCQRTWPAEEMAHVSEVKLHKGVLIAGHLGLVVLQAAMAVMFCRLLFVSESDRLWFTVLGIAMIVMFLFGASNSAYEAWKVIRRR